MMRNLFLGLAFAVSLTFGFGHLHAAAQSPLSDADRTALHQEIRAYLLENPEVIFEALDVLEARKAEAASAAVADVVISQREALQNDGYSYVGGNPDGAITLVEFLDYQCGFCKRAFPEIAALLAANDDIRFVVKEFPILGPNSELASRATIAVLQHQGPEVYKAFHDGLMRHEGGLNSQAIAQIGKDAGVDIAAMEARMDDAEITAVIAKNRALATALQITGTPTMLIEGQIVRGYLPLADMQRIVEAERESR